MNRTEKLKEIKKQKYFRIGDLFVYAVLLVLITVFTVYAVYNRPEKGNAFEVYYKDSKIFAATLSEDAEFLFYISGGKGYCKRLYFSEDLTKYEDYNLLKVSEGKISVQKSDCATKQCIFMGERNSGRIDCRAHYMYIKFVGVLEGDA